MIARRVVLITASLLGGFACGACGGESPLHPAQPKAPAAPPLPTVLAVGRPDPVQGEWVPHAPYPILLLHGMGGFNKLQNLPVTISYFNGVRDDLHAHGETYVFTTTAAPYDTSEVRARAIAAQIDTILAHTGAPKVNLIAHSQGGLDARILASPAGLGYGDRIASVTTIASPHHGTKVADAGLGLVAGLPPQLANTLVNGFLQLLEKGVYEVKSDPSLYAQANEMTTSYMAEQFNPHYVDDPRVSYSSYAGRTNQETGAGVCDQAIEPNDPTKLDVPQALLQPTASYLESAAGVNDGLVTVESARWGEFVACVPADHLKEIGLLFQPNPDPITGFDHLAFFRGVVARIRAKGF
jgi:triacylglycerol lipase